MRGFQPRSNIILPPAMFAEGEKMKMRNYKFRIALFRRLTTHGG
jgi:hypothetical protein